VRLGLRRPSPSSPRPALQSLLIAVLLLDLIAVGVALSGHSESIGRSTRQISVAAPERPRVQSLAWLDRARAYAAARPGRVAFAVALPNGDVVGWHTRTRFRSASLSKSLLAVTLLRSDLAGDEAALESARRMIEYSDNDAATLLLRRTGPPAVRSTAAAAGMRDPQIRGRWSEARVSARDMALLFARMPRLVPPATRAVARTWFQDVAPAQAWGIPRVLRPLGANVQFKGGWRPGLTHQAARVQWHGQTVALAVMTDRQTKGMSTSIATIEGLTRRVFATSPERTIQP
jgi:hypothetical protein